MAHTKSAGPHAYDYESISCACGHPLGYRDARSAGPVRCVACESEYTPAPNSAAQPAKLQAFVDAWDNAAARALSGDSSVAIPRAVYEAVVEARKELP